MIRDVDSLWRRLQSDEPYFVAEAGVNHLGDHDLAKKLIVGAVSGNANAIKFQTYQASKLTTRDAPRFWDWEGEEKDDGSQYDSYSLLDSFGEEDHIKLRDECRNQGIEFMSTPFDHDAVDYLNRMGMRAFKIASCDITNHDLIEHIAGCKKIVMLSTGASDIEEIATACEIVRRKTHRLVVMHCTLKYPTEPEDANLAMIQSLGSELRSYKPVLGLSDHTMHMLTPAIAYALGARVFERHFTIDKTLPRSADHWLSADPEDMRLLVKNTRAAAQLVGNNTHKCVVEVEQRARSFARRSIVAACDIAKGELIQRKHLALKRPGTGISPSDISLVVGKVSRNFIKEDQMISLSDLSKKER